MIETTVLNYITSKLAVPVRMEVPGDLPDAFVVLRKTDSGRENHICSAMFIARSYAKTLAEAAELNEQVKAVLDELPELDRITRSELNGDYPFNDTTVKRHCYQAVYDIIHY